MHTVEQLAFFISKYLLEIFLCQYMCIYHINFNGFMTFIVYMYPQFFSGRYSAYFRIFHQCKQLLLFLFLVVWQIDSFESKHPECWSKHRVYQLMHKERILRGQKQRECRDLVEQETDKVVFPFEVFYWTQENLSYCLVRCRSYCLLRCRSQEVKSHIHTRSWSQ